MEYYRLSPNRDVTSLRLLSPCTRRGSGIDRVYGEEYATEFGYTWIAKANDAIAEVRSDGEILDLIDSPLWFLLMSSKAFALTMSQDVRIAIQAIPIEIIKKPRIVASGYNLCYSLDVFDVVDYDKTIFKIAYGKPDLVTSPIKIALAPKIIPPYDLFQTKQMDWIASCRLRQLFETNNVTGAKFSEL